MFLPSPVLLAGMALLAALGAAAAWQPAWAEGWTALLALLTVVALVDMALAWRAPPPRVERRLPSRLPLGVAQRAVLRLHNPGARSWPVVAHDLAPPGLLRIEHLPQRTRLPPRGWVELAYRVTGTVRGTASCGPAVLRLTSPLRLWQRQMRLGPEQTVRVYPNFAAVREYGLLLSQARVRQMGIHKQRRRGEGSEFHQLRDYRQGDPLRQVDWRATARQRRLISREYQEERDQTLILLLDGGQRLRAQDDVLSHFDHALNALLLLAHVALRQGDAVGLAVLGEAWLWVPPVRGVQQLGALTGPVLAWQPGPWAPDYGRAALALLARQRKRALVLWITNLRAEDVSDLLPALNALRRRHRVVLAALRERVLDAACARPVADFEDALRYAGVQAYLNARRRALAEVRASGCPVLDVLPEELPVALVNQYLALKAA